MKMLFSNFCAAMVLGIALTPNSSTAQDAAIKADYVFAVNKALMSRCVKDYEFNTALANNSATESNALAVRDIIRTFRDCEDKYRLPQHTGFSHLAAEALDHGKCSGSSCSEDLKLEIAETTFDLSAKFIESYAQALRPELQNFCSKNNDFQCAVKAVDTANKTVNPSEFKWLTTGPDGRVYAEVSNPGAASTPIPNFADFISDLEVTIKSTFPDGISTTGEITSNVSPGLEELGYTLSEGAISVEGISNPVSVWSKKDLVKVAFEGENTSCNWLVQEYKGMGSFEMTVDNILVRPSGGSPCDGSEGKNISIAFNWYKN